ncbi:MAG: LytR/AlgR family response regulator transcription factor [Saprospiraceae bacterium]
MSNLTALIVDDEANNRENLKLALAEYCKEVNVIGEADSAITAMDFLKTQKPDLVFLDIAMPLGNGFQFLESLPEITFDIIFVTAYNQYAIRAIKFCAIDYLLKPIDVLELKQAVNRVIANQAKKEQRQKLELLLNNMQQSAQKIALPQSDHVEFVKVEDIIRCKGEKNYTWFYLVDGRKLLVSQTLKEYVSLLEDSHFFRVHQSHLVNLHQVKKYSRRDGGYVVTTDETQIPVARNRKEALQEMLARLVKK